MWGTIYHTRGALYANGLHMLLGGHNGWDLSRQSVLGRKICSRAENVVPLHRQSSDTHICPHVVTIAAS